VASAGFIEQDLAEAGGDEGVVGAGAGGLGRGRSDAERAVAGDDAAKVAAAEPATCLHRYGHWFGCYYSMSKSKMPKG
jgi:hypothetical protein